MITTDSKTFWQIPDLWRVEAERLRERQLSLFDDSTMAWLQSTTKSANEVDVFSWHTTARFDIFRTRIHRPMDPRDPRDVYQAWYHTKDISKPVCVVTIWERHENYVEWVHTDHQHRQLGIATEVLRAIESRIGLLRMLGVTHKGKLLVTSFQEKAQVARAFFGNAFTGEL